jgi:hypothetical protein
LFLLLLLSSSVRRGINVLFRGLVKARGCIAGTSAAAAVFAAVQVTEAKAAHQERRGRKGGRNGKKARRKEGDASGSAGSDGEQGGGEEEDNDDDDFAAHAAELASGSFDDPGLGFWYAMHAVRQIRAWYLHRQQVEEKEAKELEKGNNKQGSRNGSVKGGRRRQKQNLKLSKKQANKVANAEKARLLALAMQSKRTVALHRGEEHQMALECGDLIRMLSK